MNSEGADLQGATTSTRSSPVPPVTSFDHGGETSTAHNENSEPIDEPVVDPLPVADGHESPQVAPLNTRGQTTPPVPNDSNAALAIMEFLEEDRRLRGYGNGDQETSVTGMDEPDGSDEISSRPLAPPREYSGESLDGRRNPSIEGGDVQERGNINRNEMDVPITVTPDEQPSMVRQRSRSNYSLSGRTEIVRARWQPDGEVTYCPICHTQFGWVVRKHHCRYVRLLFINHFASCAGEIILNYFVENVVELYAVHAQLIVSQFRMNTSLDPQLNHRELLMLD